MTLCSPLGFEDSEGRGLRLVPLDIPGEWPSALPEG